VLLANLPKTGMLIGDRGYDSNKVRKIVSEQKVTLCIPPKKNRIEQIKYCEETYKSATRSKTSSPNSRTGGASQCDTTDAPTLSDPQSTSPQPSYSGYESSS